MAETFTVMPLISDEAKIIIPSIPWSYRTFNAATIDVMVHIFIRNKTDYLRLTSSCTDHCFRELQQKLQITQINPISMAITWWQGLHIEGNKHVRHYTCTSLYIRLTVVYIYNTGSWPYISERNCKLACRFIYNVITVCTAIGWCPAKRHFSLMPVPYSTISSTPLSKYSQFSKTLQVLWKQNLYFFPVSCQR